MPNTCSACHSASRAPSNAPPADVLQLRAALRGRQEDIERFYLAYQGMVPPQSFFNRENLGRLVAAR